MTIDQIRESDKTMLTPADVADTLGVDPQSIRTAAKQRPDLLGFNVTVIGSRTLIPRVGFLNWMDGRNGEIVFFDHEIYEYEDASESLHGLIIAESINDLFEKWSRCFFVDIYDWTVGVSEKGIDLSLPVYQKFIKEWEL